MDVLEAVPRRLRDRITVEGECWLLPATPSTGYATATWDGVSGGAHRVFYAKLVGPIPEGRQVHHVCAQRNCVNPAHLEVVNGREHAARHHGAKTHCKHGHEFTDANTYWVRYLYGAYRVCRTCQKRRSAATLEKKLRRARLTSHR